MMVEVLTKSSHNKWVILGQELTKKIENSVITLEAPRRGLVLRVTH
jgi:hypothetical protein